ncbi:cobalt-precorrin-5B (C(1))-methyltransferase CbiD [Lachnoclostridium pacaense]|nr:cobalt-precorrin-5B (C(1))-methyltransferase CbiD [Lachnoclostridium pacaense]MCC2818052.1 cobalt-precorrin-5B (C(1))-methyltransferase CbiD [Lachnoclostridium pacaense]
MGDSYIYKNQKKLRWGYTTGTCAAAASLAAAVMLLGRNRTEQVSVETPKGIRLDLEVEDISMGQRAVSCGVRKDAGDDPDVTDGLVVYSRVSFGREEDGPDDVGKHAGGYYEHKNNDICLKLTGGVGVGRVTKEGLSCEVGKSAINPVPRQMIFRQVEDICARYRYRGVLWIEISVPGALEVSGRTFNSKLGILGGISILGTSGMVEPMSETALLETIRLELRQNVLAGHCRLVVTPGNYGEAFLRDHLKIGLEQAVKCSNFIGNTIDMAVEEGAGGILLVGHGGKLIKLAAGIMNTHSSAADGRMEVLAAYGAACGADSCLVNQILEAITVDEGLRLLETREGLRDQVMERVMERIEGHLKGRAAGRLEIEAVVFTNERGILGATSGAAVMLERIADNL